MGVRSRIPQIRGLVALLITTHEPASMLTIKASTLNPIKLETGLRPNSAGIPYTLLLRTEAVGFPTFGLLLYIILKLCPEPPPELMLHCVGILNSTV